MKMFSNYIDKYYFELIEMYNHLFCQTHVLVIMYYGPKVNNTDRSIFDCGTVATNIRHNM